MHSVAGSPDDPKCWSTRLRCAILMNICAYVFIGNLYAAGLATGFAPLAHDLGVEFDTLTGLVAWAVFALGISNLFWMPTAMCIVFLAGCTWSIKANSFRDLLASRIVASFGAGSIEALGPSIIADLFSEQYFATAMALFALSLCAGSQIGPMIAGFVIGSKGWRWFFIVCAILGAVNFLASYHPRIVLISAISPQFLSAPPYHLSSSAIGVYTLSSFLGIVIGYPIAGPLTDLLSRWAAARRYTTNNTHHPKDRMPALIIPFLVAPPGLILFAYAIASSKSLYVSATGYAMQASALVFVPSVTMSYIMDVYPQSGSEAIVLINAGKNVVAFGVTVSGADWVDRDGIVRVCWELAAVQWVVLALALPLYVFDSAVRRFAGRFV
ncbi:hypothetical protein AnigIFM63604_005958 [Aspergillus niger]|uniref:Major facilitator superfamily (MFS) profile domain-containing protein n=1 Tax=Aspergillus niger TaxID=5061 RepID=A0A9W6A185_ASPNG|nr:hypothetical protein AnigIFM63604_005958 [Aspergillus niger]